MYHYFFVFNDTATTEIYTLSLHDALPIWRPRSRMRHMRNCAPKQGLYDPRNEHDACGIGFLANIKNRKSHDIVRRGLDILCNLRHRGAVGADPLAGDGSGILIQLPDAFLRAECERLSFVLPPSGEYAVGMVFLPRES